MNKGRQFKDSCDDCKKMDYCKGHDGLVLCKNCITRREDEKILQNDKGSKRK